jgi:hypothetical protein
MDLADKIRKIEALIVSTLPEKASAKLLSFCKAAPARKKVAQSIEYSVKNDNRDVERGVILRCRLTIATDLTSRRDFRRWFKTKISTKIKTTFGELGSTTLDNLISWLRF